MLISVVLWLQANSATRAKGKNTKRTNNTKTQTDQSNQRNQKAKRTKTTNNTNITNNNNNITTNMRIFPELLEVRVPDSKSLVLVFFLVRCSFVFVWFFVFFRVLSAKLTTVADVFDERTSSRSPGHSMPSWQSFRHQRSDHHDLAEEPAGQLQTDYCVDPVTFRARRSVRSDTGFFRAADHDPFDRSKQEAVQWISRNKRKDDEVYCGASQNEKAQFVTEPVVAQTLVWTWTIARRHVRWLNNIYN